MINMPELETKQTLTPKLYAIKRVKHIPQTILNDNISLVEYGVQNFQSICQITHIQEKKIDNQYFIGKSNKNQNIDVSFAGLEILSGINFEEQSNNPLERNNKEFEGLIIFQDVPPKMKSIIESENSSEFETKNAFDHCVDVCINALPSNYQSWIISTIERNKLNNPFTLQKFSWRKISVLSFIVFLFSSIFGIPIFLTWKFKDIPYEDVEQSSLFEIPFLTKLRHFLEDPGVRLGLGFWSMVFIIGLFVGAYYIRTKKGFSNNRFLNFKSFGNQIADKKEETAFINHDEEKAQWGAVEQSFVILVRGKELVQLKFILQSLKLAIEGIYHGCIFSVEGTIILPNAEKTDFKNNLKYFFGWTLNSFWKHFTEIKPFKPTTMSIPRSGKNYFRLIREKFIPGAEIIEGSSYKVPIERTIGDWYLGKVYRKLGHDSYPYYLTPDVLTRQGLIVGQTGRGKTFLMYKLLEQMSKFNPEIHYCIFDLKGGEYTRFFAKDATVFIPGSEIVPLGINIFRINEDNIESNKRMVSLLLNEFLLHKIGSLVELSAFMKDVINQAIDRVFLQPVTNRTMRTFVQSINIVLEELEEDGLGWIEKTRTALKARFRELYTGWFKKIFCVEKSNFNVEMLQEQNIIFKVNQLVSDNDLSTLKFLVNIIIGLVSSYAKELQDLDTKKPWLVCVFEEAQKIIPLIKRTDTSDTTTVENFVEIGRAHGVVSIGIGQSPAKISDRFHQAGFIVDFGTESDILDKIIFGKDFQNAPAEKEQLATSQMCFVKLTGEKRVLLEVDKFDYSNVLSERELENLYLTDPTYQSLRKHYNFEPISLEDLEGKSGRKRLVKKKMLFNCQKECVYKNDNCQSLENYHFTRHKLPRKNKKQLLEMLAKERGLSFIRFCYHLAENKQDAECILLHYLIIMLDLELIDCEEAEILLMKGKEHYLTILQELEEETKQEEFIASIPLDEIEQDFTLSEDLEEEFDYSFNFNYLLLENDQ